MWWPIRRTTPTSASSCSIRSSQRRGIARSAQRRPQARSPPGPLQRPRGTRPVRLHGLRPQWLDGSQPVLDARRADPDGGHGQVLQLLRLRLHATARPGPHQCRTDAQRTDARQPRLLPLPPRLGRRHDPHHHRVALRPEGQTAPGTDHHRQPHQQPQRLELLGIGTQYRLRLHVSAPQTGRGRREAAELDPVDQAIRDQQARSGHRLLVRDPQRDHGIAARV